MRVPLRSIAASLALATITALTVPGLAVAEQEEPTGEPVPKGPPVSVTKGTFHGHDWELFLREVYFVEQAQEDVCEAVVLNTTGPAAEACGFGVPEKRALNIAASASFQANPVVSHIRGVTAVAIANVRMELQGQAPRVFKTIEAPNLFSLNVFVEFFPESEAIDLARDFTALIALDSEGRELGRLQRGTKGQPPVYKALEPESASSPSGRSDSDPADSTQSSAESSTTTAADESDTARGLTPGVGLGSSAAWLAPLILALGLIFLFLIRQLRRRRLTEQISRGSNSHSGASIGDARPEEHGKNSDG